ncbi:MAG: hypothetical protein QN141_07320 [Armatimonadota bacterium]|nr:hypothetical protein [Armatimonadota bacterium]MDR7450333.1 hypothetical protein [Armatimonadota bacterium]MDR7467084.1 hypothetical protein [Armatimonadota bacterium]MDR7493374.1 hypothetical protein [Armatimonadota bacterium]MDR7499382.1 hypothetical protein [Armatimonadota bacterium]
MKTRVLPAAVLLVAFFGLPPAAQAATQAFLWPSQYAYATPAGTYRWSATTLGLQIGTGIGPAQVGGSFFYGPVDHLSFAGSPLAGFRGQLVGGEASLRLGLGAGGFGLGAFAGYGGFVFTATGPSPSDAVLLSSAGFRYGVDGRLPLAPGTVLRGSWTALAGLSNRAELAMSSPAVAAQHAGPGGGSEYSLGLALSPLPLVTAFVDYRTSTFQTTWSGGPVTSSTYTGYLVGVQLRF